MSVTVQLASGTRFRTKSGKFIQLTGAVNAAFVDAVGSLDEVAEILAETSREDPSMASNVVLNAAVLNRQIVAPATPLDSQGKSTAGYDPGTALDVTYGPSGNRLYTSRGLAPLLVPATTLVPAATPTRLQVDFDQNLSSVLNNYLLGFSAKVNGVARAINAAALQGDNSIIWLTLASPVTTGQVVLVSFDPSVSDIVSATGAKPAAFTDAAVINQT
jgi:hypothetical protein